MMIREFVDRTGFEPTATEYAAIEEKYYSFDGSKDEFCKAWVKDGGIQRLTRQRAEKIADLEKQILEERRVWQEQMKGAQIMVEKMREQLDRELEWKPAENAGTGMSQEDYEELAKIGTCLTVQEAEKFLYTECGFAPENILILDKASSYEVNKYRRLRESGTWERKPVYCSSDYNYIRFDCMGWQWELINGELQVFDRTGNRRFGPVKVCPEKAETTIYRDEKGSREYIIQAWAEAMEIYRSGEFLLTFSPDMEDYVKSLQKDFMPEDTQTGMIQAFLDNYEEDYVCSTIIYQEVFHQEGIVPKWQSKEIGDLMDNEIIGWEKHGTHRFPGGIGIQRSWKRIQSQKDKDGFVKISDDTELPFE